MTDAIIKVENLGKRYRIGVQEKEPENLRETVGSLLGASFRYLRQMTRPPTEAETLWVLRNISFEVKPGEVLGIVGRNGAGKSTLLKILSRITEPTEGQAIITGRIGSLLEVGTGFHPELTGRENTYLNGSILGMRKREIDRKFDEIVAFAEVEKFIDTPVKRYSSGMYVRLAFAVAAHLEPEILIIDEVLAVGDAAFQKKCLGKMENISQQGRTVLFVSHNMSAITQLCSRCLLIERGRPVLDGSTIEIVGNYINDLFEAAGSVSWPEDSAPGTDELKLTSVKLLGKNDEIVSTVEVGQTLRLYIGYQVRWPNLRFRCAIKFRTQGIHAFTSVEPTEEVRTRAGNYYSIVEIPAHLLAEGTYTIGLTIFNSSGTKYHFVNLETAIAFQVFDPLTSASARGDYTQQLTGVVSPRLKWWIEFEGEEETLRLNTPAVPVIEGKLSR